MPCWLRGTGMEVSGCGTVQSHCRTTALCTTRISSAWEPGGLDSPKAAPDFSGAVWEGLY